MVNLATDFYFSECPLWVKSGREHAPRLTAALPPTPDVKRGKADIGNLMSVVGCIPVVIGGGTLTAAFSQFQPFRKI
jgi:hypothetical protein